MIKSHCFSCFKNVRPITGFWSCTACPRTHLPHRSWSRTKGWARLALRAARCLEHDGIYTPEEVPYRTDGNKCVHYPYRAAQAIPLLLDQKSGTAASGLPQKDVLHSHRIFLLKQISYQYFNIDILY